MNEATGLRDRERPAPAIGWLLAAGWLLPAVILAAWRFEPAPVRDVWVELLTWTVCYPVAALAVVRHVRRRAPQVLKPALALFVLALTVRTAFLVGEFSFNYAADPDSYGFTNPDGLQMSVRGLLMLQLVSHQAEPLVRLRTDPAKVGNVVADMALRAGNLTWQSLIWQSLVDISLPMALQFRLLGFSCLAAGLPHLLLSGFFVVQLTLLARRVLGGAAGGARNLAGFVGLWAALAPEFLAHGTRLQKDQLLAVLLIYLVELFIEPRQRPIRAWIGPWCAITFVGYIARPYVPPLFACLAAYLQVRGARRERWWLLADLALSFGLFAVAHQANQDMVAYIHAVYRPEDLRNPWIGPFYNLLMPAPVVPGLIPNDSPANTFLSIVWPTMLVFFVAGAARVYLRLSRVPVSLVVLYVTWFGVTAAVYPGMSGGLRHRMQIQGLALSLAAEAFAAVACRPRVVRRRWSAVAVTLTTLIWLRSVAMAFADRGTTAQDPTIAAQQALK